MMWTQVEKEKLDRVISRGKDGTDLVLAVADTAVELYFARLKPSGQVAEDVRLVDDGELGKEQADAVSRLATGAQEAESLRARVVELETERDEWFKRATVAETMRDLHREERDAAQARAKELESDLTRLLRETKSGAVAGDLYATTAGRAVAEAVAGVISGATRERMHLTGERDAEANEMAKVLSGYESTNTELVRERSAIRAAVERLKAKLEEIEERAKTIKPGDEAPSAVRWALEGDAPQAPTSREIVDSWARGDGPQEAVDLVERITFTAGLMGHEQRTTVIERYPCSPTCTHDDAATPGHPERVKERSKAVKTIAIMDPIAELARHVGAKDLREVSCFRIGHEKGVEAMRAACWEAVLVELEKDGHGPRLSAQGLYDRIKSAIEGVSP